MKRYLAMAIALLTLGLLSGCATMPLWAQGHEPAKTEPEKAAESPAAPAHAAGPEVEQAKPESGHEAADGHEGKEEGPEDMEEQMKQSAMVKWFGKKLGITDPATASLVFLLLNFAILAGSLGVVIKKHVPGLFRDRTAAIRKGVEEARKASAEASARLGEIEARLGRLDGEIASIRTRAEEDGRAEEERLRAATEEERRKIIASAEQEIATAANVARRDLKQFAAELSVSLAEKKIAVDDSTDRALVQQFTRNLSDGGRG